MDYTIALPQNLVWAMKVPLDYDRHREETGFCTGLVDLVSGPDIGPKLDILPPLSTSLHNIHKVDM